MNTHPHTQRPSETRTCTRRMCVRRRRWRAACACPPAPSLASVAIVRNSVSSLPSASMRSHAKRSGVSSTCTHVQKDVRKKSTHAHTMAQAHTDTQAHTDVLVGKACYCGQNLSTCAHTSSVMMRRSQGEASAAPCGPSTAFVTLRYGADIPRSVLGDRE